MSIEQSYQNDLMYLIPSKVSPDNDLYYRHFYDMHVIRDSKCMLCQWEYIMEWERFNLSC